MKTPLTYYGGKQNIAEWIVSKFPLGYSQLHYIEPFAGGAAVFFEKTKSQVETISDLDKKIYNFFKELKTNGEELFRLLELTLYNENELIEAKKIIKNPDLTDTERAYYTYLLYQMTFSAMYSGTFGFSKNLKHRERSKNNVYKELNSSCNTAFKNKLNLIRPAIQRLKDCQILNRPAMEMINKFDSNVSLFYLDPPYPETTQLYQDQFSMDDFNEMTKRLKSIKGRFLLSFYKKEGMELYDFKLHYKKSRVAGINIKDQKRTECLATNY